MQRQVEAYKTDLETNSQLIKALEEEVAVLQDKAAEASSHELAVQELQAMADSYKSELQTSAQRVTQLEGELLRAQAHAESEQAGAAAVQGEELAASVQRCAGESM